MDLFNITELIYYNFEFNCGGEDIRKSLLKLVVIIIKSSLIGYFIGNKVSGNNNKIIHGRIKQSDIENIINIFSIKNEEINEIIENIHSINPNITLDIIM